MSKPDRSMEPRPSEGSWLLRLYEIISVAPEDVLADARGLGIKVSSIAELRSVRTSVLDSLADQYIRNAKLMTSLSGAGLGAGGLVLAGPELSILSASIVRLAQRLAVVYGFDYKSPAESLHVWSAIARALGVENITDGTSKVAVRSIPKLLATGPARSGVFKSLIRMIAARLGLLVTERGLARALPLVGAGVAAVSNFQLIRDLGGKIQGYFRERHITWKVEKADDSVGATKDAFSEHEAEDYAAAADGGEREPVRRGSKATSKAKAKTSTPAKKKAAAKKPLRKAAKAAKTAKKKTPAKKK